MRIKYWRVALVVWMLLIFLASSSLLSFENTKKVLFFCPESDASTLIHQLCEFVHVAIRKFAHIAEYAILTYLWFRSLWTKPNRFISCVRWSVLLSILYAVLDELHQHFVPNRDGQLADIVWDSIGSIALGLILWYVKQREKGQWILGALGCYRQGKGLKADC